jgi:hypothetical protein
MGRSRRDFLKTAADSSSTLVAIGVSSVFIGLVAFGPLLFNLGTAVLPLQHALKEEEHHG